MNLLLLLILSIMLLNVLSLIPIHSRKGLINNRILINTIRSSSNTIRSSSNSIRSSNDRYIEKRREFQLTNDEEELFELFRNIVDELKLGSTIRIAGGWVRDKLLGVKGKPDIDVALDNMTGRDFINSLNTYYKSKGQKTIHVGIIQQNPEKSKHLETATAQLGIFSVDFVNLRTEVLQLSTLNNSYYYTYRHMLTILVSLLWKLVPLRRMHLVET